MSIQHKVQGTLPPLPPLCTLLPQGIVTLLWIAALDRHILERFDLPADAEWWEGKDYERKYLTAVAEFVPDERVFTG